MNEVEKDQIFLPKWNMLRCQLLCQLSSKLFQYLDTNSSARLVIWPICTQMWQPMDHQLRERGDI